MPVIGFRTGPSWILILVHLQLEIELPGLVAIIFKPHKSVVLHFGTSYLIINLILTFILQHLIFCSQFSFLFSIAAVMVLRKCQCLSLTQTQQDHWFYNVIIYISLDILYLIIFRERKHNCKELAQDEELLIQIN